jgi:hypothetical protein
MAFKNNKNAQLMDYMVSLHYIDFTSWGALDNGLLSILYYQVTLFLLYRGTDSALKRQYCFGNK